MAGESSGSGRLDLIRQRLQTSAAPVAIVHLARAITGAGDPDLSHEEFQARLPRYAADETSGLPVSRIYPDLKRHLDLCARCEATYLELIELSQIEATMLTAPIEVPAPDLSFLPRKITLVDYVRTLSWELVKSLTPDALGEFPSVAANFFNWLKRYDNVLEPVRSDLGRALGFAPGETPDVALILISTQLTTQALVEALAREEIQVLAGSDRLLAVVREHAERSARQAGLDPQTAQAFAQKYAEQLVRDPGAFWESSSQSPD